MKKILYSAEWASSLPVGEAIVSILCDELRKRNLQYELEYKEGDTANLPLIPEFKNEEGKLEMFQCVTIVEGAMDSANKALDHIFQNRGKDLKREALRIARLKGYIATDKQSEEYERALANDYGWVE